uniref:AlNc14C17G1830 protein n=1 Tax=Albugo laibachii Nc14 TaxID=890382 RepID=F0W4L0_9STRA|nr:AlNc14C17G1830 [Albugo laibachii Nc14]CCA26460.1 AlNc14C376G11167 [Albugo laibachii Nc14]|eukprot:CCA26460.1 AlNc14C376G11167 [Albugo laibachii Nc14]
MIDDFIYFPCIHCHLELFTSSREGHKSVFQTSKGSIKILERAESIHIHNIGPETHYDHFMKKKTYRDRSCKGKSCGMMDDC